MIKKNFSKGLALAVMLGVSNFAYAAPVSYDFSEVVVSASRTNLNIKELPQSAEVITKEEIRSTGATNVYEALRASTNINMFTNAAANHKVQIRGSEKILILVNGHRITNDKGGSDQVLDRFDSNNIERIEVLRGPAATIYGSDAMAGVINIVTKSAAEQGTTIGVNSSRSQTSNFYRIDTGKDGKAAASFAANITKQRYLDWGEGTGTSAPYGLKQNFRFDVDYDMDLENKLLFSLEYDKSDLDYVKKSKAMGSPAGIGNMKKEIRTANLGYKGSFEKNNVWANMTVNEVERDADTKYKLFSLDARNSVKVEDNFTLTYGGELRKDEAPAEGAVKSAEQWASFIQGEYKPSDKLLIVPSVRYDHHDAFGSHTSPSVGLTYFADDSARVKATYGTAYRAPSIKELFGGHHPNPSLKPEKSKGFEIAYEKDFSEDTTAKVAYFKNKEEDGIKFNFTPNEEEQIYYNVDKAEYEGVEFSLDHNLGNGFRTGFNYEYLDARNLSNNKNTRLKNTAPNTFTVRLQWIEPEYQEWSVTAWNRWLSDYKTNSDGKARSISTFDLVVNKKWEDGKYNTYLGVDNLFDHDSSLLGYYGRMFRFGVDARF